MIIVMETKDNLGHYILIHFLNVKTFICALLYFIPTLSILAMWCFHFICFSIVPRCFTSQAYCCANLKDIKSN